MGQIRLTKAVQLGAGFMMRFHSQHQEALKIIRSGKLGRPVYGRAQLSSMPGNDSVINSHIFLPIFHEEADEVIDQYATAFEKVWAHRSALGTT